MSSYIFRNVPAALWRGVKARSESEHVPLRSVFLQLLAMYATGQTRVAAVAPAMIDVLDSVEGFTAANGETLSRFDVLSVPIDDDDIGSLLNSLTRIVDGLEKIHAAIVDASDKQVSRG